MESQREQAQGLTMFAEQNFTVNKEGVGREELAENPYSKKDDW